MSHIQPCKDQCSITIPATVHGFSTSDLRIQVADPLSYTLEDVDPAYVHIDPTSFDVTITFPVAHLAPTVSLGATKSSEHAAITFRVVAMGEVVMTPTRTDAS
jgi:hypothetical protein